MNRTLTKFAIAASSTVASLAAPAVAFAQGIQLDEDINPGTGFADDFGSLVNGVLSFVMVIAALLVFMYLILGGIEWIRNKITAAVIGLVILAASYAILLIVLRFLGFENLGDVFDQTKTLNG
jgi:hypothetical protein